MAIDLMETTLSSAATSTSNNSSNSNNSTTLRNHRASSASSLNSVSGGHSAPASDGDGISLSLTVAVSQVGQGDDCASRPAGVPSKLETEPSTQSIVTTSSAQQQKASDSLHDHYYPHQQYHVQQQHHHQAIFAHLHLPSVPLSPEGNCSSVPSYIVPESELSQQPSQSNLAMLLAQSIQAIENERERNRMAPLSSESDETLRSLSSLLTEYQRQTQQRNGLYESQVAPPSAPSPTSSEESLHSMADHGAQPVNMVVEDDDCSSPISGTNCPEHQQQYQQLDYSCSAEAALAASAFAEADLYGYEDAAPTVWENAQENSRRNRAHSRAHADDRSSCAHADDDSRFSTRKGLLRNFRLGRKISGSADSKTCGSVGTAEYFSSDSQQGSTRQLNVNFGKVAVVEYNRADAPCDTIPKDRWDPARPDQKQFSRPKISRRRGSLVMFGRRGSTSLMPACPGRRASTAAGAEQLPSNEDIVRRWSTSNMPSKPMRKVSMDTLNSGFVASRRGSAGFMNRRGSLNGGGGGQTSRRGSFLGGGGGGQSSRRGSFLGGGGGEGGQSARRGSFFGGGACEGGQSARRGSFLGGGGGQSSRRGSFLGGGGGQSSRRGSFLGGSGADAYDYGYTSRRGSFLGGSGADAYEYGQTSRRGSFLGGGGCDGGQSQRRRSFLGGGGGGQTSRRGSFLGGGGQTSRRGSFLGGGGQTSRRGSFFGGVFGSSANDQPQEPDPSADYYKFSSTVSSAPTATRRGSIQTNAFFDSSAAQAAPVANRRGSATGYYSNFEKELGQNEISLSDIQNSAERSSGHDSFIGGEQQLANLPAFQAGTVDSDGKIVQTRRGSSSAMPRFPGRRSSSTGHIAQEDDYEYHCSGVDRKIDMSPTSPKRRGSTAVLGFDGRRSSLGYANASATNDMYPEGGASGDVSCQDEEDFKESVNRFSRLREKRGRRGSVSFQFARTLSTRPAEPVEQ